MVRFRFVFLVFAVSVLVFAGGVPAGADTTVTAHLKESNDSGVTGTASLTATDSGGLKVVIQCRRARARASACAAYSWVGGRGALHVSLGGERHRW